MPPLREAGRAPGRDTVLIVYTHDFEDAADVLRVGLALRALLGYEGSMSYKTDACAPGYAVPGCRARRAVSGSHIPGSHLSRRGLLRTPANCCRLLGLLQTGANCSGWRLPRRGLLRTAADCCGLMRTARAADRCRAGLLDWREWRDAFLAR